MEKDLIFDMPTNVKKLQQLIEALRSEEGCPWDRKQNAQTMGSYLVEEVYELVEAIESGNLEDIEEELGDVLFQVLFIGRLYDEAGHFDIEKTAEKCIAKMIRRHPHVFGEEADLTTDQVRQQWQKIKQTEKESLPERSILDSIPSKLPALMRAYRVSERAAGWGFDWDDLNGVLLKVEEEWAEFKSEITDLRQEDPNSRKSLALELGDIFFTLVNVGRFLRVHPETALSGSTKKFEKRFRELEQKLADQQQSPDGVPREMLDRLWDAVKKEMG